jgi:hypothetical protein
MFQEGKAEPISTPTFLEYFESELAQLSPDDQREILDEIEKARKRKTE